MPKPIKSEVITLRGKTNYAKILGEPMDNFDKNGKEWKLDFILEDRKDLARLKALNVSDRVKQKEDYLDGAPHMTLRQKTEQVEENGRKVWKNRLKIVDVTGQPWDETKLVGNGSVADIKLRIADYGRGMKAGIYIVGIRILELVPYNSSVMDELDESDPYFQKANQERQAVFLREEVEDDFIDDEPFD